MEIMRYLNQITNAVYIRPYRFIKLGYEQYKVHFVFQRTCSQNEILHFHISLLFKCLLRQKTIKEANLAFTDTPAGKNLQSKNVSISLCDSVVGEI